MSARTPSITPEQQVQEDLMRLDAYRSQLSQLLQQHQLLESSRADHLRARETLDGLDRIDPQREVLIPLGAETYLRGSAAVNAPVLLGIGSGVVAEMDRAKASEVLHERLTRLDEAGRELGGQVEAVQDRIDILTQRIESMTQGGSAPSATDDVGGD